MEDFIDNSNDDPVFESQPDNEYSPTPIANALTAALYAFVIGLALYGGATTLGLAGTCAR